MTLVISKGITLARGYPNDPDVLAYIAAVQAADETASPGIGALEIGTVKAIDDFVTGCKADGIWPAIKASCILAGARTLTGALVPLVGTAPTNFNFVSGDYNRKTGLVGNGSTKYLDSNRNNNSDPQNNNHNAVYVTAGAGVAMGVATATTGGINTITFGATRNRNGSSGNTFTAVASTLIGTSRVANGAYVTRVNGSTLSPASQESQPPVEQNLHVFKWATFYGTPRVSFYSIGESLNLALLDARVTDLINAFGAAIP
jgi:hypothetical protein